MADSTAQNQASNLILTKNKTVVIIIIVVVILVTLASAGFYVRQNTNSNTSNSKGSNGVNIKVDGNKKTIQTNNGDVVISEGELPTNIPKDVSIYKNSEIEKSTQEKDGVTITLKSSDSVTDIANFYKKDLEKNGWREVKIQNFNGSSIVTAKKSERLAFVTISKEKDGSKTTFTLVVSSS